MSSFSMKPQLPTSGSDSGVSTEQWNEWSEYLHTLIKADDVPVAGKKGKTTRTKTQVGILNFIMDMGFQPQADGQYDTKCALPLDGEDYSQEELDHIAKYPTNDFIWVTDDNGVRKRKQTAPKRPEQEYAFFFDFPEVMVDWAKNPNEDMHKLGQKPLRISYNGRFGKIGQLVFNRTLPFTIDFKTKVLGSKNPIYKIADKMGVAQAFESSGYDLGVLAGRACKWSVISEKNVSGDKTFYNLTIKDASKIEEVVAGDIKITVEQQIPKCDVEFVGVHFNAESYDSDTIEYIKNRKELVEVVQRATSFKPSPVNHPDFIIGCEFKDSGLAKALGELPQPKTDEPAPAQEKPKAAPKAKTPPADVPDSIGEDTLPF
jgi:hypothetical protein